MKKSKILSLVLTMVMVCTLFISTQQNVQAADGQECVDGSYLTNDDSSEVTVGSMSRGVYLILKPANAMKAFKYRKSWHWKNRCRRKYCWTKNCIKNNCDCNGRTTIEW